jgi:hypothetical protein
MQEEDGNEELKGGSVDALIVYATLAERDSKCHFRLIVFYCVNFNLTHACIYQTKYSFYCDLANSLYSISCITVLPLTV